MSLDRLVATVGYVKACEFLRFALYLLDMSWPSIKISTVAAAPASLTYLAPMTI